MTTQTHGVIEWWGVSNGNLLCVHNGFRYCIARLESSGGYIVTRNGVIIALAPSVADAKLYVSRED